MMIELQTIDGPVYVRPEDVARIETLPRGHAYEEEGGKCGVTVAFADATVWLVEKRCAAEVFTHVNACLQMKRA